MKITTPPSAADYLMPVLLLLCLLPVSVLLPFNGLYGQDAHEYLRLTRSLQAYMNDGTPVTHSYFPITYPLVTWLLSLAGFSDIMASQLVSMLALTAAFAYMKELTGLLFREKNESVAYLIACFFLSPYVFRFGLLSMSDMLCLFFVMAALFHCLRYVKMHSLKDAALFSFFAGCAVSARYAVLILLLIPAVYILLSIIRSSDYRAVILMMLLFCCALLPDWFIRGRILFLQWEGAGFIIDYASNAYAWSPQHFFRNEFQNPDGQQHYAVWNIVAATFNIMHPAFLFAGIFLLFFLRREDFAMPEMRMLAAMVILYGLYIAGLHYQNNRYLLQSFPPVLLIFYPAFRRMKTRFITSKTAGWITFLLVVIIQLTLFCFSFQKIYTINCTEREIAASLKAYEGQTVYTCDITGALSTYNVKNPVIDLYFNRVSPPQENALLLFNYDYFSEHYQQKNPMLNWAYLQDHLRLRILQSYPGGWALYAMEGSR